MKQILHQFRVILKRDQIRGLFFLFLGSLFIAVLDTGSVALMVPFMSLLTNLGGFEESAIGRIMNSYFKVGSTSQALIYLSIGFILLYIIRGICKITYHYWQARLMAMYRTDLSTRLFKYVMQKPYSYHLAHNTAETQRLVSMDVVHCFVILNNLISCSASILTSIGILAVLIALNWQLTCLLIAVIVAFVLWMRASLIKTITRYADMNHRADAEINRWVSQSIGGLKNIIVKRRQPYYVDRYCTIARDAAVVNSFYLAIDMVPKVLVDTGCMVLVFATVLVELALGKDVNSSLPMFSAFALAAMRLIPIVGSFTSVLNYLTFYRPSLKAISSILETGELEENIETDVLMAEEMKTELHEHRELQQGVEVLNICFKYEDAEDPLYEDISLFIPAKKSVAFVGITGSGKTTLADIILGLHKPSRGKILADGIDISENPVWWSSLLGYIPQFIYLSDDTIRANVALGEPQENINDDWIWKCLEKAQMKDFVLSLPNRLDTVIGENGMRLSGGQRQRIGIARALYSNPQFLVMDEATSSLDNETEQAIVDSINALSGDITLLIIAHRLSTIENCDMVYRIERGEANLERG